MKRVRSFEPELFLTYPKNVMTVIGIWPRPKSRFETFYNLHGFVLAFVVSYTFMLALALGIYQVKENVEELPGASYYPITHLTFVIKFTTFVTRREKYLKLMKSMKQSIFVDHLPEQKFYETEFLALTKNYMKYYYCCCFCVWAFYGLYPAFDSSNKTSLPVRTWLPIAPEASTLNYIITYVYQLLGLGVAISTNASYDVLSSALINTASVQIQVLKDNLENATERLKQKFEKGSDERLELLTPDEDEFVYGTVVNCIEHHKAIVKYIKDVQGIFGFGMFFQFISGGTIICILGLEITVLSFKSLKFTMTIFYFMAMVSQNSLYCWNGNQVIVESSEIVESCYKMDWYRCSTRVKKSLFILMERSKMPLKVKAGNFFELTLSTLTTIMRSSYSYFAVLRQVYNK